MQGIGHALRNARRSLGYTLAEVAQKAGSSLEYIHEIETGKATPSLKMLERLSGVLNLKFRLEAESKEGKAE